MIKNNQSFKMSNPVIENFTGIRPGLLHYGNIQLLKNLPKGSIVMIADTILPSSNEELELTLKVIVNLGYIPVFESSLNNIVKTFLALAKNTKIHHTLKSTTLRSSDYNQLSVLDQCYPVLMVADVLFFNPKNVYVGYDQTTHVELYVDTCKRLNIEQKTNWIIYSNKNNILNLRNPKKKMSKSDIEQNGVISVNDTPEQIEKKIKSTPTSFFNVNVERNIYTDNLMNLYAVSCLNEKLSIEDVYDKFNNKSWFEFKTNLISNLIKSNSILTKQTDSNNKPLSFLNNLIKDNSNLIDYILSI